MARLELFHGSTVEINSANQLDSRPIGSMDYGGVVYLTASFNLASRLARSKRATSGHVYVTSVNVPIERALDLDVQFPALELRKLIRDRHHAEEFARSARIVRYGNPEPDLIDKIADGEIEISGEQAFLGLSRAGSVTSSARTKLSRLGYDAVRYTYDGGTVYALFSVSGIRVNDSYIINEHERVYRRIS
jgi:hypothetical protein